MSKEHLLWGTFSEHVEYTESQKLLFVNTEGEPKYLKDFPKIKCVTWKEFKEKASDMPE